MSELDVSQLVRHTRLLLRFYPPGYRAHRSEEILDTLLETTRPGRGWPPAREVASVIGGGLRARRAANLSQGLGASLRHTAILAAALIMIAVPGALLSLAVNAPHDAASHELELGYLPGSLLAVLALAAAWCGRRWLMAAAVVVAALAAVVCWKASDGMVPGGAARLAMDGMVLAGVPALLVLVPLTRRAERPPASLLWMPCSLVAAALVNHGLVVSGIGFPAALPISGISGFMLVPLAAPYTSYPSLAVLVVAICWLATDVRPLAAVAIQFLLYRLFSKLLYGAPPASDIQMAIAIAVPLVLTCALVRLLRHRARTAPPTIG